MPADDFSASLASRSDAELEALEADGTLTNDDWAAVEAERARRLAARRTAAFERPRPEIPPPPEPPAMPSPSEDPRLHAAIQQLQAVLLPGETLDAWAVQRRLFALTHRRVIVGATSGRFVSLSRRLFGGYALADVRWQDLHDANVQAGTFGATLTISSQAKEDLASSTGAGGGGVFVGLRKDEAQRVYRLCQAQEQAWREKRRVRDLDELRARSGGIQLGAAGGAPAAGAAPTESPVERLRRAKEMLTGGLITDAEYEAIKARVVDGL